MKSKKNLVLVGMPGSGKSTIGYLLSKKLNKKFIDIDKYIENLQSDITSVKDFEKVITRLEVLEEKVREIRIHLKLNDNMDLLK